MDNNIVPASKKPRAVATEKNGIVLYWIEELGVAGLHQSGLAGLFGCGEPTVKRIIDKLSRGNDNFFLSAEIVTLQGIRVVTLVTERGFTKFCRLICESKASKLKSMISL
jgi:DNA-binding MarR family transcriptional regulator